MNTSVRNNVAFESWGLSPDDLLKLGLPQEILEKAHGLMKDILAAESSATTLLAQKRAQDVVDGLRFAKSITWNQARDLGTLYKAALSERLDQLGLLAKKGA